MAQWVNNLPAMQETQKTRVPSLSQEEPLEEEMATHSSFSLKNLMDRGAWGATVHESKRSQARLSDSTMTKRRPDIKK